MRMEVPIANSPQVDDKPVDRTYKPIHGVIGPACMTLIELNSGTRVLCERIAHGSRIRVSRAYFNDTRRRTSE